MNSIDLLIIKSINNDFIRFRAFKLLNPFEVPMWEGDPGIRLLGNEIKVGTIFSEMTKLRVKLLFEKIQDCTCSQFYPLKILNLVICSDEFT